jgi:hypothetical protein
MADATSPKIVITGTGAVCAAGLQPDEIFAGILEGRCAIGPIRQWDTTNWPTHLAGEIPDFNPRALVEDRKLQSSSAAPTSWAVAASRHHRASGHCPARRWQPRKPRRATARASSWDRWRQLPESVRFAADDRVHSELKVFGSELRKVVNPRASRAAEQRRPIGIKYGLKHQRASRATASTAAGVIEPEALPTSEADASSRRLRTPIEPQMVLIIADGLLASETLRPFDIARRRPIR